ncbi:hypothetical protein C8J56DRAFT_879756 [Mycena floridula]|nr:hypothetical protein C8J56DRAFT_879756 [Mycena floridula]
MVQTPTAASSQHYFIVHTVQFGAGQAHYYQFHGWDTVLDIARTTRFGADQAHYYWFYGWDNPIDVVKNHVKGLVIKQEIKRKWQQHEKETGKREQKLKFSLVQKKTGRETRINNGEREATGRSSVDREQKNGEDHQICNRTYLRKETETSLAQQSELATADWAEWP